MVMKWFVKLLCQTIGHFRLLLLICSSLMAEERLLWQPLHSYETIVEPVHQGRQDRHQVNPFLSYTNIGTDFGFVGPAENLIGWQRGQIGVTLGKNADDWAGMWHSLSRLARMKEARMNFNACYPAPILAKYQPKVTGLRAIIRGQGKWKIDLSDENKRVLWSQSRFISHDAFAEEIYDLPTELLSSVKFLTWVAEPGADLDVDQIDLRIQTPDIDFDQWLFLSSYAKALTCWSDSTGTVRDRGHTDDGSFDSIASTGLFCLATAAAATEGIVSKEFAVGVLRKSRTALAPLRGPYGLLPHFIRLGAKGALEGHPGTEFSTIDTSLFDLSQLIAAKILGEEDDLRQVIDTIKNMRLRDLINADGYVSHGVFEDGKTVMPYQWKDWGGESALVLLMLRISDPHAMASMSRDARPNEGTGFIAEIQSLLFSDFDAETPDAISGANWLAVRKQLLRDQKNYHKRNYANAITTAVGAFGLSAGEQRNGQGYSVGGVELKNQDLLHPHYMLMAAALDDDPTSLRNSFKAMEKQGWFTTLGLAENISVKDGKSLPMLGSLNACFESLGAYHFSKKYSQEPNRIYRASQEIKEVRNAMKMFYP
jgi:hypothetical protein